MNIKLYRAIALILSLIMLILASASCSGKDSDTAAGSQKESASSEELTTEFVPVKKDVRVCIDPGHGFGDIGAVSPFIDEKEKDITIVYAKKLRDILEKRGYDVYLTHDGETFPITKIDNGNSVFDFKERTSYVNSEGADYFISIHCNTYEGEGMETVNGARIYYSEVVQYDLDKVADASEKLAESIKDAFPDWREPKSIMTSAADSYYVTHWIESCSLLLEIGYLTHEEDANNMIDETWTDKMVRAIADGIDAYFDEN